MKTLLHRLLCGHGYMIVVHVRTANVHVSLVIDALKW
jgi:hypothetical protein